ncbi:polysaccharide deacetylase family protein [Labrys wisconsinensis]|uniref:Chitooligosaccharide deacetylase n=1 Tax=Labrys wisconsinensis TaxID=425677 RepID=A0ABU0J510_9HYPH|nr:polysaccharide deacetylase family protein [Labrys wisconsinensis]MDQ0469324.1 peptidoglycan/xylan/chitin deacetylase (PgdA/CDA1 family) [Labrys wisconsinensis]
MSGLRQLVFKSGLDALHLVGAHRWMPPPAKGRGAIFMLHHVRPWRGEAFAPNRHLEVTPEFLDRTIARVRERGFDLVTMDEAHRRIGAAEEGSPFAAFTLDDGYRDNALHAVPVFQRHGCPYTIYVASDFAEGRGVLWWVVLAEAIRRLAAAEAVLGGIPRRYETADARAKGRAFAAIYADLLRDGEPSRHPAIADLARQAGFAPQAPCRELCMTWPELAALGADPLATFGAHTRSHPMLAKLPAVDARAEILEGRTVLERTLGRRIEHFAYPVGNAAAAGPREFAMVRELGFRTGVTTRRGLVHGAHAARAECLPRVSLNGHFQALRYVDLFLSGAPFALADRLRPADAA